jgi:hypothetical protein
MELFIGIISTITGLFGVWLGSHLTTKNSIRLEKKFMAKQLRISKIQELTKDLLEYMRGVTVIQMGLISLLKNDISLDNFKAINDKQQDYLISLQRMFVVNKVFFYDFGEDTQRITDLFGDYCNRVYDGFQFSEGKKKVFDGEEVTYRAIENSFNELIFIVDNIIGRLNTKLNQEIKDLE